MKTVLFFLYILGTAAAIPTNARFLSDHSKPTADPLSSIQQAEILVTLNNTATPMLGVEDAENEKEIAVSVDRPNHKAEKSSVLKSKEENHDQSADQDQSYSPELGLQDEEESESDLSENLEYIPSEDTLDLKEDMGEPQKKKLPENTDFLAPNISSIIDPNQQESITKTEKEQEQPINDLHPQLNRSNEHSPDVSDQGNQEQDPNIPNGEEEGEEEPGEVGTHNDNQEREREFPKEHSNSKEEEDSTQSDDVLEESYQPTQVSKMQKDESELGNQEQEDSSNAEMEDKTASKINKHNQDAEWQSKEEKPEVISNHEEIDKKSVSEALFVEPTEAGNITPRNHGANDDGDDDPRHDASDDYEFIPSEDFIEAERSQSISYHLRYEEERERERARENGNVDTSEPGEYQGVRLFTIMLF